jgi:hypothetical protein
LSCQFVLANLSATIAFPGQFPGETPLPHIALEGKTLSYWEQGRRSQQFVKPAPITQESTS